MCRSELPALTGIRFYAALLVFLSHVVIIPGMERLGGEYLIFNVGVAGVSFFFVLSGFILTYNYGDLFGEGVAGADYRRFVWDRLTKIYPVHLMTLAAILPIAVFSPNLPLDWRALPFHLLLAQCFWPLSHPTFYNYLNVPSWSISCEWFFYLLAPIAMFLAAGKRRRWLLLLATGLSATLLILLLWRSGSAFGRLYFLSWFAPSRFLEFLAGVAVAQAFVRFRSRMKDAHVYLGQAVGLILFAGGMIYRRYAPWPFHGGLLYVPGSMLLVYSLAFGKGWLAKHLSQTWLNRLGLASFSFYLVHAPILRAMRGIRLHYGWEVRSWSAFLIVIVALFVIVQTVAWLVYSTYEIPAQRWLRKWWRARSTEAVVSGASTLIQGQRA